MFVTMGSSIHQAVGILSFWEITCERREYIFWALPALVRTYSSNSPLWSLAVIVHFQVRPLLEASAACGFIYFPLFYPMSLGYSRVWHSFEQTLFLLLTL
jgi:hypothetical protein